MALYPPDVIDAVGAAFRQYGHTAILDHNATRRAVATITIPWGSTNISQLSRKINAILKPRGICIQLKGARSNGPGRWDLTPTHTILLTQSRPRTDVEHALFTLFLSWNGDQRAIGSHIGFTDAGDYGLNARIGCALGSFHIAKIWINHDLVVVRFSLIPVKNVMQPDGSLATHGKGATYRKFNLAALREKPRKIPLADPKLVHKIVEALIFATQHHAPTDEVRDKATAFLTIKDNEYHLEAVS